jgi:hypothetical protein
MSRAEEFLAKSIQLWAEAEAATDSERRSDLEWLANSYRLLAEHAQDEFQVAPAPPQQNTQQPQQQQQGKLETDE